MLLQTSREDSQLDSLVKCIINKIRADVELENLGRKWNPRVAPDEQKNCEKRNKKFANPTACDERNGHSPDNVDGNAVEPEAK